MLFLFELCSLLHSHVWVKTVAPLETWHLYTGAAGAAGTDLCPVCVCSDLSLRTDLTNNLNQFSVQKCSSSFISVLPKLHTELHCISIITPVCHLSSVLMNAGFHADRDKQNLSV